MRARRVPADDVEDSAHDFLRSWLGREKSLAGFERGERRFREFLSVCLRRFLADWYTGRQALRRGGGMPHKPLDGKGGTLADRLTEGTLPPRKKCGATWPARISIVSWAAPSRPGCPVNRPPWSMGEAVLTMQGPEQKCRIVAEAFRLLQPGGRCGIHELSLTPEDLPSAVQDDISREMSRNIRVGPRPLSAREWRGLRTDAGFRVASEATAPMPLLEPRRVIQDEGLLRALPFVFNVLRTPEAWKRVISMRRMFRRHRDHLAAISLIAMKP